VPALQSKIEKNHQMIAIKHKNGKRPAPFTFCTTSPAGEVKSEKRENRFSRAKCYGKQGVCGHTLKILKKIVHAISSKSYF